MGPVSDPVNLSRSGPPSTVLAPFDPQAERRLAEALTLEPESRRAAILAVLADFPRFLAGWAALGDVLGDLGAHPVERYAAYRVGYHRGLDALRGSGWRGTGFVRSNEPTNRGFLRALEGLGDMAAAIGELDEAERCRQFLQQLDPPGR